MQPSTTYGALGSESGEFVEEGHIVASHEQKNEQESSSIVKVGRGVLLSILLLALSFVAVSVSSMAGAKTNVKSTTTLESDGTRIVFATLSDYDKEALFRLYVDDYGKKYKTEEYQSKLTAFKAFLEQCDSRNMAEDAAGGTAIHGITKFADLTPSEFNNYLGYVESSESMSPDFFTPANYTGNATVVDWAGIYTTDVKDQGYCGSCWAFSATEQIESDAIRELGWSTSDTLSPQQIVSCDGVDGGCDGGDTEQAYQYVMSTGGLSSDEDYPYASYYGFTKTCETTLTDYKVTVSGFATLKGGEMEEVEEKMINYVKSTGPLSVCLDASTWASYQSGILSVCPTSVDHCVQVVGVNSDEGYWKVRNSWGTDWGEDGYIYLRLNANTCGITYDPTFTYTTLV